MKKLYVLTLILFPLSAFAQNSVGFVDIDVALQRNGSARITEIWNVDIDSDNTEWYLAKYDLAQGSVSDLHVSDLLTGEEFEDRTPWEVDLSRSQKAGRSGIVDKGYSSRYELCWGVGSNGPHRWKVEYTHNNLMVAYADSCAFNHMFLSDDMATPPDSVCVTIRYPGHELNDSTASIWGFRYKGYVAYENGTIVARTTQPMSSSEGVDIMCAFDKDLFEPEVSSEDTFSVLKEKAFKGSSFGGEERAWWQKVLTGIAVVFGILLIVVLYYGGPVIAIGLIEMLFLFAIPFIWKAVTLYPLRRRLRKKKLFLGTSPWRRDIPSGDTLSHVPQVMSEYSTDFFPSPDKWDKNLTAAYIMKLICNGGLKVRKETDRKTGRVNALLEVNPEWERPVDGCSDNDADSMKSLYDIIRDASGKDLILQDGEMNKYRINNGRKAIRDFYSLRRKATVKVDRKLAQEVLGLYNYLKEFTLLQEKGVVDVALWDNYLIYATVFGIADKVMKQMKELAPDYFLKSDAGQLFDTDGTVILTPATLYGMSDKIRETSAPSSSSGGSSSGGGSWGGFSSTSSGGGGWASYGGGGGHTGGGGGGGR